MFLKRNGFGILGGLLALLPLPAWGELVVGFEDVALTVPPALEYTGSGGGVYYNGSDGAGGFESVGVWFKTAYNADWMSWSGWAYSTTSDVETASFSNEFSSITGAPAAGSVYAVAYYSAFEGAPTIELPETFRTPQEVQVSNVTYPYLSMRDGDAFAKQFGAGDYFKMIWTGYAEDGTELGSVDIYLADFREETDPDYILSEWVTVDLSALNAGSTDAVAEIRLDFESTDAGEFGINTPTYAAIDNLLIAGYWAGFKLQADGWVHTENFLGWVYPEGDFVWVEKLGRWTYLPESHVEAGAGAWAYVPR